MRGLLAVFALLFAVLAPARADVVLYGPEELTEAIKRNDYRTTERLLRANASPERTGSYGRTGLIIAAGAGHEDIVVLLLEHRAKIGARDKLGGTALSYAAQRGHAGTIGILLDAGAEIDTENRQGLTPLMLAAGEGRLDAVQLLLERGADAGLHDYTGRTALDWARRNNRRAIERVLRTAGVRE